MAKKSAAKKAAKKASAGGKTVGDDAIPAARRSAALSSLGDSCDAAVTLARADEAVQEKNVEMINHFAPLTAIPRWDCRPQENGDFLIDRFYFNAAGKHRGFVVKVTSAGAVSIVESEPLDD